MRFSGNVSIGVLRKQRSPFTVRFSGNVSIGVLHKQRSPFTVNLFGNFLIFVKPKSRLPSTVNPSGIDSTSRAISLALLSSISFLQLNTVKISTTWYYYYTITTLNCQYYVTFYHFKLYIIISFCNYVIIKNS